MLKSGNKNRILIIRLSSIGDIILTTGVINYIKDLYPESELYYLTVDNFASLIENNNKITRVINYNKKLNFTQQQNFRNNLLSELQIDKFDLIVDLHNNFRTKRFRNGIYKNLIQIKKNRLRKILLVNFKSLFNLIYKSENNQSTKYHTFDNYIKPIIKFAGQSDNENEIIQKYKFTEIDNNLSENFDLNKNLSFVKNSIIIAPGAKHFTKRLPLQKYVDLSIKLLEKYEKLNIILLGGKEEIELGQSIIDKIINVNLSNLTNPTNLINLSNLTNQKNDLSSRIFNFIGELTLLESMSLISESKGILCNDSGIMHLASATKTPIIATFGSTTQELGFTPLSDNFLIIEKDVECRPCSHIGLDKCPKGHFRCMNEIQIDEIILNIISKFKLENL